MITTSTEARKINEANQNETVQQFADRVGVNVAESHYRSEFIKKAEDFVNLYHEVEGTVDAQAIEELISLAQFLAIRGDAYAEIKNDRA